MNQNCDGVVNEYWHDCFWYQIDCPKWEDSLDDKLDEPELPDDTTHDGTPGEKFQEWLNCYEETYQICGDADQHSAYYDCYWDNVECEDKFWHDCYWFSEDCSWMVGQNEDWIEGFRDGYAAGYWDGVLDNTKAPRDVDMGEFQAQMIV